MSPQIKLTDAQVREFYQTMGKREAGAKAPKVSFSDLPKRQQGIAKAAYEEGRAQRPSPGRPPQMEGARTTTITLDSTAREAVAQIQLAHPDLKSNSDVIRWALSEILRQMQSGSSSSATN